MKTINNVDDLSDDLCLYCPLDDGEKGTHGVPNGYISCEGRCCQEAYEMYIENKKTPGVINQYAPGEFYAVTESDIWLMRYHKNILFAVNCKTTRKNKFEIKVYFFGN